MSSSKRWMREVVDEEADGSFEVKDDVVGVAQNLDSW